MDKRMTVIRRDLIFMCKLIFGYGVKIIIFQRFLRIRLIISLTIQRHLCFIRVICNIFFTYIILP
ncbi:MAG: hypothetical protein EA363_08215 [Balneolaceae bacterium]|nr:MAG: hypothetical protein EA363_08215 [Balneolaceae bacterium]